MRKLPFKESQVGSIGVELEIQVVDPVTFDLSSAAKFLLRKIRESKYHTRIKPEVTQSMLEINSSVHTKPQTLLDELRDVRQFLLIQGQDENVRFAGGGTHPFQKWSSRKIYPTKRFKSLSKQYRYLSKHATVFGEHIHIGCDSGDNALYLTHALARYVPHFLALSASSPFYQGIDTGFQSMRLNIFNSFPTSGVIPFILTWDDFSKYFYTMRNLGIIQTMKDVYWDIRPKPEFGTVEIRVCDTPLSLKKAVLTTAYLQSLSHYLLAKKPFQPTQKLYYLYGYNRFQACRYGLEGESIDPFTAEKRTIADDILATMKIIQPFTDKLNNTQFINELKLQVMERETDATYLREIYRTVGNLPDVVREQCDIWEQGLK